MSKFLLEIGTEELPARFLSSESESLSALLEAKLKEAGLSHGDISVKATPRRLSALVQNLSRTQAEDEEIVMGPAIRIAYDAEGKPSKALLGFAKSQNIGIESIFSIKTEKGEYAAFRKKKGGADALQVLPNICHDAISELPFPKRMRWGEHNFAYARPIRWILALLDDEIVHFKIEDIDAGSRTYGHRVHGIGPFEVENVDAYEDIIRKKGGAILDPLERRALIIAKGDELAGLAGGKVIWNEALLDEVQGLSERPFPILGAFKTEYLQIPAEVLLTSMQTHQKSFGVQNEKGELLPYFITVLNIEPANPDIIKKGWERVLHARLEDARFYWEEDLKADFHKWLEKLEHVVFIGPLGSMGDKSRRLEKLCEWLARKTAYPEPQLAARAGLLAKADLVSGMVGEFDVLQGVMGGIYARKAGENEKTAAALQSQYLPSGPDSPLPQTFLGCLLSVADKADTLAGCFGLNMIPTGAADPNGLRRCALGIIRIFLDENIRLSVRELFLHARNLYGKQKWKLDEKEYLNKLREFFEGRLRSFFVGKGFNAVIVNSALAAGFDNLPQFFHKLQAISQFMKDENSLQAMQALKRINNILRKTDALEGLDWNRKILQDEAEKNLSDVLEHKLPELDNLLAEEKYEAALKMLNEFAEPVASFFDGVMIMHENQDIRQNRIRMLKNLEERYGGMIDFSTLQI